MQTRFMRRTLLIIVGLTILQALLLVAYAHYEAEVLASESDRLTDRQLYSRARENAERALALNPNHGYARYYLGYLELLQERYPEAINVFQSAIPLMPHLPALLKMLAQGYFFSGDYARATQTLDRYLRMDPAPRAGPDLIFRMWAQALCYSQEFGRASIALAKAEAYQKFRTELLQTRVLNSILLDQIPMADYYYRMFKFFAPTHRMDPGPLFANALAAGKLQSLTRFLELNRMRGELDGSTEKILALAYAKQARLDLAIATLKRAMGFVPNDPEIPLFLGDIYYQQGDHKSAEGYYRLHLQLAPESRFKKEIQQKFPALR
ncbi:MAG: hypothetical protein KatS3mg130_0986 [Candidatus Sumerlaea sp.]|nr:MAG: hypothetical protein KatS3mg130_0986 [Candidatus Sumerlaea sp.]